MLFNFIRYTQPGWQFNLLPRQEHLSFASCYVSEENCPQNIIDERYETKSAQLADAGYRLWNKGVLLQANLQEINDLLQLPKPSLRDEYIFIRKYWGKAWTTFALMLRLFTFKNPFTEIFCYLKTRNVHKLNQFDSPFPYGDYDNFQSVIIASEPLVAVIIPTLNRYEYLKEALHDLEKQSYKNFEVIIYDQSENFNESFYEQFSLNIKLHHQNEKLLWTARNNAISSTDAAYLLFFDDDSSVNENWIFEHLKCMDYFAAGISAGISIAASGQKVSESYGYFRWADQFDSGNAMVHRSVFEKIGLFDEQFNGMRMGDGEFGFRAYINGIRSVSNPRASRLHLKVSTGGLREMGSWDGFRPKKWFAPKPVPSVIYLFKKYFPDHLFRNAMLIGMMLSNIPYKYKRSSRMLFLSVVLTLVKSPLLFIQYHRSFFIANKMLKNSKYFMKIAMLSS